MPTLKERIVKGGVFIESDRVNAVFDEIAPGFRAQAEKAERLQKEENNRIAATSFGIRHVSGQPPHRK